MVLPLVLKPFSCSRDRHAWDLHIGRGVVRSVGSKAFPIIAGKGDVGGGGLSVDDAADFLPWDQ